MTSDNRIEYIHLVADYKLNRQIRNQCNAFRWDVLRYFDKFFFAVLHIFIFSALILLFIFLFLSYLFFSFRPWFSVVYAFPFFQPSRLSLLSLFSFSFFCFFFISALVSSYLFFLSFFFFLSLSLTLCLFVCLLFVTVFMCHLFPSFIFLSYPVSTAGTGTEETLHYFLMFNNFLLFKS